jgi:hypothetical protein
MMRDEQGELIPGLPWQEQDSTRKKSFSPANFELNLRGCGGTSTMLHLEHSFVWCGNLDISESGSEICGKF